MVIWDFCVFQVPTLLRSIQNTDILSLRQQTQFVWDTYFASVDKIVTATLEVRIFLNKDHRGQFFCEKTNLMIFSLKGNAALKGIAL